MDRFARRCPMTSEKPVSVNARDPQDAFDFLSVADQSENSAYISLDPGKIY
jgi:hypothetical protein